MSQRGHVRQRGTSWTAYWSVRQPDGSRRQVTKGGFRTRRDAQKHLNEVLGEMAQGRYVEPSKLTLAQYLEEHWLPTLGDLRPSTIRSYTDTCRNWIIPVLGGYRLSELSPAIISRFYNDDLRGAERRDGRGTISGRTAQYVSVVLKKALGEAVPLGLIPRNPADGVKRPEGQAPEMQVWDSSEARAFLEGVADDRLYALYLLALTRGPRRGELLGLRWSDVDLEAGRFSVRQTVVAVGYEVMFSEPKTRKSRRTVPLDDQLVAALKAHRKRQLEERMAAGPAWVDNDLVFCSVVGQPLHPQSVSDAWERHIARLGLKRIRFHDARHTCATLALRAGVPVKVVSEWLGHSSTAITSDTYSHAIPAMLEEAGEQVTRLIFGQ